MDGSLFASPLATGAADAMLLHRPVLLDEALTALKVDANPEGIFVDGTYGRGGHTGAILKQLGARGVLHAFDRDPEAEADAATRYAGETRLRFHAANFARMPAIAAAEGFAGKVNGLLLDLGVSSPQFDDGQRGFSFSHDGPLDMRMNPRVGESVAQWLSHAREEQIADVLFNYGDERNSRRIARRIVESRDETPIVGTAQLAALIASVPGPRSHKIHPATRSFQALRIHINGELDALRAALDASFALLAPGGRLAIISFHSLEDRMVKQFLRDAGGKREARDKYAHLKESGNGSAGGPARLVELGRIFPSEAETESNPRSRSSVLRVAEKSLGRA